MGTIRCNWAYKLFKIGISIESGTVVVEEFLAFFKRYFTEFYALGNPLFELTYKLFRVVLHVVEHLFYGFSVKDLVNMILPIPDRYVGSIGISEEIMHVAEDLLIGSYEENTKIIGFILLQRVEWEHMPHVAICNEIGDFTVAVAGDVL